MKNTSISRENYAEEDENERELKQGEQDEKN